MGRNFHNLDIFKQAYAFVLECYPTSEAWIPEDDREMYRQLRRALLSIPLNIAEGCGSRSQKVYLNHLSYAYGSCREVEVLVMLCRDLAYMHDDVATFLLGELDEIKKRLFGFMKHIEKEVDSGKKMFSYSRPHGFYDEADSNNV